MADNQGTSIWDNPYYAFQQQLMTGANLAKNLNAQALLGLLIGTGLGTWGGLKLGNWQQERDFIADARNRLIDQGYTNVTYDKDTRRFSGVDANGNTFFWRRNGDPIPQQAQPVNPAIKSAMPNPFGELNLGWTPPQKLFPTGEEARKNYFTPPIQNFDWQQTLRNSLLHRPATSMMTGELNLGWKPPQNPYPFQTGQEAMKNYFTTSPQSFNWQQNFLASTPSTIPPTQPRLPIKGYEYLPANATKIFPDMPS